MEVFIWLVYGVLLALPLIFVAYRRSQHFNIKLFGISLITAALIYVGFAFIWGSWQWVIIELMGVVIYGSCYLFTKKLSVFILPLGWLLHPVWDIAVHYSGPGNHIAPHWYTIACLSFDVLVASYLFYKIVKWNNAIRNES